MPIKDTAAELKDYPRVALMIEQSHIFGVGLMRGVGNYLRQNTPWNLYRPRHFYFGGETARKRLNNLKAWKPDGIILREQDQLNEEYLALDVPKIYCAWRGDIESGIPNMVEPPNAVGDMGADYLRERGFHNFGYCGYQERFWSRMRGEAFSKRVNELGGDCFVYDDPVTKSERGSKKRLKDLALWLKGLPKPVAIMTATDDRSLEVIEAAFLAGLMVPEEVAVLGVNNDPLTCDLSMVPLSSIKLNEVTLGYEAAALLDKMMKGHKPKNQSLEILPTGVATRLSTDIIAVEDREVAQAVSYIHQNYARSIGVDDITTATTLSRRGLENRFQKSLGVPIYEMVQRTRLNRACSLLAETQLPVAEIAANVGFSEPKQFSRSFQKYYKKSPRQYRKSV